MNKYNMIEVEPLVEINVIRETLSRMGIANKKKNLLYPTCYLYQNYDSFFVVHFKELFLLTRSNGYNNMSVDDIERKNSIIFCLMEWGLINLVNQDDCIDPHDKFIFVLPHKDKKTWSIQHKFNTNYLEVTE